MRLAVGQPLRASGTPMSDFIIGFTSIEQIMWTVVRDCPTNGSGPCAFVHTCVDYETGDDGVVRPMRKEDSDG